MRLVSLSEIDFTPGLDNLVQELDSGAIIQNNILLIRYHGISLHNFLKLSPLESIINLKEVIGNFAFNLWIGNYDRKDDDYSVDSRLYACSIDYSLSGPGFVEDLSHSVSIGAFFQTYDFNNTSDSGWALPDVLLRKLREMNPGEGFFSDIVKRIESVSDREIGKAFAGLHFYRLGSRESIETRYREFLRERRDGLRSAIRLWCSHGYPKGHRMQEQY